MFIKSMILDGFKSYGHRVEVSGFDPAFNAITGLNGTGKSNILDAICFVLGITNLSNVRAGSLTELIYKQGQAGITKATVSITFDNRDKSQAPVGYETADEITVTRQIVMGGKNKYLINGINVQNKRVSDLFCSVQLNVNNPHFLIMQGRITKVLNMKPPEILSMIEEAAGTKMYETKKNQALVTIRKKDSKIAELESVIEEDINPKIQQLTTERARYQEYQRVTRLLAGVTKLNIAYRYYCAEQRLVQLEPEIQTAEIDMKGKEDITKDNENECKAIDKEIAEMHRRLDAENCGILQELEKTLEAAKLQESHAAVELREEDTWIAEKDANLRRNQRALQDVQAALQTKQAQFNQAKETDAGLRAASESSKAALSAASERAKAVRSGRGDGDGGDVQEQLTNARSLANNEGQLVRGADSNLKIEEDKLQKLRCKERALSGGLYEAYAKGKAAVAELERRRRDLESELAAMPYDAALHAALSAERIELQDAVRTQQDVITALKSRTEWRRFDFKYDLPRPDFNASSVHGILARLIEVSDPTYYTAIETVAGGKLYNVVVDTDATSRLLLNRGNLPARTTIIPLTKVEGPCIDARTSAAAQRIGGGAEAVQSALSLVSAAAVLTPALRFVFGNTLVCRDLYTAKQVCFHPSVRRRCVTLDGDECDPGGTLFGGAPSREPSVLQLVEERAAAERSLRLLEQRMQALQDRLRASDLYHAQKDRVDKVARELQDLEGRIAFSSYGKLLADITQAETKISEIKSARERSYAKQQEAAARVAQLELLDMKAYRERQLKNAEAEYNQATLDSKKHNEAWQKHSGELENLRLQVEDLVKSVADRQLTLEQSADAHAASAAKRGRKLAAHQAAEAELHNVQERIARHKAEVALRSQEVAVRAARKDDLRAAARDAALRCKEIALALTALRKEHSELKSEVATLIADQPWIPAEKQYFGSTQGSFNFAELKSPEEQEALVAQRDELGRQFSARAQMLHSREEEEYKEVMHKKNIVEADRLKLKDTMRTLDEKKRATLLAAAERVDRDFGAIFSSLLPGTSARLVPPPGCTVLDGLEVRVAFNGTWKESLGELSGGQRSLVALALVLAMLRFKPAPLYILDEVDAALDLSHTQNIGLMLRDHFQTSQFIIVSLKDGMFNNANVLFRTRFQDGMSSVQRTVNAGARPRPRN